MLGIEGDEVRVGTSRSPGGQLVKEYCDSGGAARRKNLAAWMQRLYRNDGMHDVALKMIYKAATGRTMPEPKR